LEDKYNNLVNIPISEIIVITERRWVFLKKRMVNTFFLRFLTMLYFRLFVL
jgi:hypothetical protein